MAMMMARLYTGSHDIITLRNAYHGLSGGQGHAAMGAPAVQPAVGEGDVCLPPVASRMIGARWLPAAPPLPLPRPPTQRGPWACWGSTRGSCLCPRCGPHPTLFCRKSGRHPAACTPPAHQRLHGDLSLKAWHKRASLSNSRCLAAAWRLVITGFGAPPPPSRCRAQGAGVHHALNPNPYRGVFGNDGPAYARDVADLISAATPGETAPRLAPGSLCQHVDAGMLLDRGRSGLRLPLRSSPAPGLGFWFQGPEVTGTAGRGLRGARPEPAVPMIPGP